MSRRLLTAITVLLAVSLACGPLDTVTEALTEGIQVFYVHPDGSDDGTCLNWGSACRTVGGALRKADGGDIIRVSAGDFQVYSEDIEFGNPIFIQGEGADRTRIWGRGWLFLVASDATFIDVTLAQESSPGDMSLDRCVSVAAPARLRFSNVVVDGCEMGVVIGAGASARLRDVAFSGGDPALQNDGDLLVDDSRFEGGATYAITNGNLATARIDGSAIVGNATGGIFNAGAMVIEDTLIDGNGTDEGYGVHNTGQLEILRSTISGSGSGVHGNRAGVITVVNSTFSGNGMAVGGYDVPVSLNHVTIADNLTGIYLNGAITLRLQDSILSGNNTECLLVLSDASSGRRPYQFLGTNLRDRGETPPAGSGTGCPLSEADLRLDPLADNGGPTPTHALGDGSEAIDAATGVECPASDQRGIVRPVGATCDVGAYEAAFELTAAFPDATPTGDFATFETVTPGTSSPKGRPTEPVACRLGPNDGYGLVRYVDPEDVLDLLARNHDTSWLQVILPGHAPCWAPEEKVEPEVPSFDPLGLPLGSWPPLPTNTPEEQGGIPGCIRNGVCTAPACGPNDPNGIPCTL